MFRCGTNVAYKLALTDSHIAVHVRVGALECEVVHICKPIQQLLFFTVCRTAGVRVQKGHTYGSDKMKNDSGHQHRRLLTGYHLWLQEVKPREATERSLCSVWSVSTCWVFGVTQAAVCWYQVSDK